MHPVVFSTGDGLACLVPAEHRGGMCGLADTGVSMPRSCGTSERNAGHTVIRVVTVFITSKLTFIRTINRVKGLQ